jgi:ligand-binding sensor domain-containing protein
MSQSNDRLEQSGQFTVSQPKGQRRGRLTTRLILAATLSSAPAFAPALEPPVQVAQYAHTSWTARESAELGLVMAMAQTPDGYLWIAASFGLYRFDGLRFKKWEPPGGQSLPDQPYTLLVSRDGTLWIGTYAGLASWNGRDFVRRYPEIGVGFVTSLFESRDGTVWAGVLAEPGRLCAVRAGQIQCSVAEGGGFGGFVWSLAEDRAGNLWVGAESGLWRWSPGAPRRYPMAGLRVGDLTTTVEGEVLVGVMGGGLKQVAGEELVPHRFRGATKPNEWLADGDVNSNKLLRDREGGLWIGTRDQGIIHVKDGQSDTFTQADGLSGNIACSLFEDREGNIWFGSSKGLDRFRKLPVTTLSSRQGVPHELTTATVATTDGSMWVATRDGLARWKGGRPIIYRQREGLPHSKVQTLYQDADGRLWASTDGGLAYFAKDRFVAVDGGPSTEVYAMTGDAHGNLWLSGNKGLARLNRGRFVENLRGRPLAAVDPRTTSSSTKAGCGWHSGTAPGCRMSRTARSWNLTLSNKCLVKASTSPASGSTRMDQSGQRPEREGSAGSRMAAPRRSRSPTACRATGSTGRFRTTRGRCGSTRHAASCRCLVTTLQPGSPTPAAG